MDGSKALTGILISNLIEGRRKVEGLEAGEVKGGPLFLLTTRSVSLICKVLTDTKGFRKVQFGYFPFQKLLRTINFRVGTVSMLHPQC